MGLTDRPWAIARRCAAVLALVAADARAEAPAESTADSTADLPTVDAPPAEAPPVDPSADARARELYDNGVRLYDEGNYGPAVLAFEEAYAISRRPALLYNVANACERWGELDRALEALHRYRAYATAHERDALERRIRNLEQRIAAEAAQIVPIASAAPIPSAAPALPEVAPVAEPRRRGRWVAVGVGGAAAVGFGAATVATYLGGQASADVGDRDRWDTLRPLNHASAVAAGVGAGVALVGLAVGGGREGRVAARIAPDHVVATTSWTF